MKAPYASAYMGLRDQALHFRVANLEKNAVHAVLMDWFVGRGTVTVVAVADGTASVYLSTGGGYIGGSQADPAFRDAALQTVKIANSLMHFFDPTESAKLPGAGELYFYLTTSSGCYFAKASEDQMKAGTDGLSALGNAMQWIIAAYRTSYSQRQPS